jgi:hypothetical protein
MELKLPAQLSKGKLDFDGFKVRSGHKGYSEKAT